MGQGQLPSLTQLIASYLVPRHIKLNMVNIWVEYGTITVFSIEMDIEYKCCICMSKHDSVWCVTRFLKHMLDKVVFVFAFLAIKTSILSFN